MAFAAVSSTTVVPRKFRFRFVDIRACRWLVPDERCLALPVPVNRNRFLVPLWVFILGIVHPYPYKTSVVSPELYE